MSTTMTVRLEEDLKKRLDQLATVTNRTKSFLAAEAIKEFVSLNEWQLAEVEKALKEADADDFAADGDVRKMFQKWQVKS